MSILSQRLRQLRESRGLTQLQLASILGTSKSSVNMYERGEREPGNKMVETIADFYNVDIDYLFGRSDIKNKYQESIRTKLNLTDTNLPSNVMPITTQRIPLVGTIACGKPIYASEDRESYVVAGSGIRADCCLRCQGDSMTGARIMDGDIVFIRQQEQVENGEIAAVIIDDEATLKRVYYYPQQNLLVLRPDNPEYPEMMYSGEELDEIHILGKAIAFQSDVR